MSPCWVEYFTTIGLIVAVFLGYRICQGFYNIFNQFVLGRIFGPALDLKKLGKWAVVTGATDGIGLAYAKQLAKRGICIVFVSRSQEKLEHCAQEFAEKYGVETKTIVFDFSQPYDKYETVKKGLAGLEVGILVNNVGMGTTTIRLTETPDCDKKLNDLIHIQALSCAMMTHCVLHDMMERRKGVIVNVSSFTAYVPMPFMSIYPATKAFVDFFSRCMSKECETHGILFQCLLPHFVQTKMLLEDREPNLMRPSPDTFCKSAIGTLGRSERTFGYFPHFVLVSCLNFHTWFGSLNAAVWGPVCIRLFCRVVLRI
ncbi:hypothetical protein CAPTEDRAFT_123249 [Capitella teleta]|uniref:Uncharacterized protein n=1 Tax=Capitella teleta TaxID=283909 RepID=R7UPV1_CAPTE|nr:hypothetical protein CAPTEDRAFT_123249 [Capitella teleta]|eukprot:ELU05972.1 hypothetical protein CAPTEDRAFT_123249 [Capitella teleta]